MVREHGAFLEALDAGQVVTTAFMRELSADDDAAFEDLLDATEHGSDAARYDVEGLRAAVERDSRILQALADEAAAITPDRDPKLRALADALVEIAQQAEREATDSIDEAQKRKALGCFRSLKIPSSGFEISSRRNSTRGPSSKAIAAAWLP